MKKHLLTLVIAASASNCMAQTRADYEAAIGRFQQFYNHQQMDSIFGMLSDRIKGLMPLDVTTQKMGQLHTQMGDLNSFEFSKEDKGLSFYKTSFSNATLSLAVSLNKDNKLETFRFIPYKDETTVPGEQSNFVLKTATGNIYGSLVMPQGTAKVPVVLIIAGSGPTDRNGNSDIGLKAAPYKMLADSLQKEGIASVRYDKRGVAESSSAVKGEADLKFDDLVQDAAGFIKMIKADSRFSKVVVLGHSEGSLVGMMAAAKEKPAAFVSLAGIAQRADKILEKQLGTQSATLAAEATLILDSLDKGYTVKIIDSSLMSVFRPSIQPYMISWLKYEPAKEIKKLTTIPVLILQGTTDIQVGVEEAESLKKACPHAELKMITGMNHVLKQADEDRAKNIATYSNSGLPLSPGLMTELTTFIQKK